MMTVRQVSALTGVTVRALQYYDKIGLLSPAGYTDAGYRLYDDTALERLQQILLFRELEFSLNEIKAILNRPDFDLQKALMQQIQLLTLKKEHLETLISLAKNITKGVNHMDFTAFDTSRLEEYAAKAKAAWGGTDAYREYERKSAGRTAADEQALSNDFMALFAEFGAMKELAPKSPEAQVQVKKLRDFISAHYYDCTDEILSGLGKMYAADEAFAANIDASGGKGTAAFVCLAIEAYCNGKR